MRITNLLALCATSEADNGERLIKRGRQQRVEQRR